MSLSTMQIFNKFYMTAIIETLAQMIDKFNAASRNTIRLTMDGFEGDFLQESFFQSVHSAQRRVDRYAVNGAVDAVDLTELKRSSVKIAGGFGPIRYEPSQLTWLMRPTAQAVEVISRNFAEALLSDQLNTAIAALVAALSNNTDAVNDVSAASGINYSVLNNTHALFGDHSTSIITDIMTGAVYHKLISQNIANATQLFQSSGITVVDILGKAVVVTDAPALIEAGVPVKQKVLGLTESAAIVHDAKDIISNIDTANGSERIVSTIQMDYTFALGLKGYSWDETNGGKSPTDADIQTGTNWDVSANDVKFTAGVIAIGDQALN